MVSTSMTLMEAYKSQKNKDSSLYMTCASQEVFSYNEHITISLCFILPLSFVLHYTHRCEKGGVERLKPPNFETEGAEPCLPNLMLDGRLVVVNR